MKILVHNCRGLGNAAAVLALLDVLRRHNPEVVFLSETHLDSYPADCLRRRMRMDFKIVQASDGRKVGIPLLWRAEVKVSQLYAQPNYIDVRIKENAQKIWRITRMYGEFKWRDKYKTWQRIRDMHSRHNLPWILIGDLNEILYDPEKEGGAG
jgi:hypothetical protein